MFQEKHAAPLYCWDGSSWVCYWVGLSTSFLPREKSDGPRKHPFFKTINSPRPEAGLVEPPTCQTLRWFMPRTPTTVKLSRRFGGRRLTLETRRPSKGSPQVLSPQRREEVLETGRIEALRHPGRRAGCGEGNSAASAACLLL
uniref:G protein-coupled receptor kinase 7 n=1 Tax=Pipistrellus kuhlii TaxID=59472 RepID=A0A7J7WCT2_PIPKU|nr:G protein-coupled receptor kinase 7 [Pipistrellus kuhlii]